MRITKFGHACVRIEHDGRVVVVDPGMFTDPEAVDGADAVLVTHEHPDHLDAERLRATDAPVFTVDAVAARLRDEAPDVAERVTVVGPGEEFTAALPVRAVGELHAVIHPDLPRAFNCGYVVTAGDQKVFHPGDALTPPGEPVDLLCVVVSAPWMRAAEGVDFARLVGAPRNLAIHDRVYSDAGLRIVDGHFGLLLPESQAYTRLPDGADL
ncbi:MBL fold metallo-hydrolase [Nocardioides sp.]|uniref:MBL fold metallo-hydrolase n=1 Tax=Nocardioides sp. TaxID=35761 RepID=UPI003526C494